MRIYSYIKNNLNLTKSEVMALDKEERILVNGKKENLSRNIRPGEIVTVDGVEVKNNDFRYYVYNKPKGVICTNNRNVKGNIIDALGLDLRIYSVGRLDKDTYGLLFLTNDNKFTHYILESKDVEKEYIGVVKNKIDERFIRALEESIMINGKMTIPAVAKKIDDYTFSVILRDGRYHEVRKLVINGDNILLDLKRIRIGKYILDEERIQNGDIEEIKNLKEII